MSASVERPPKDAPRVVERWRWDDSRGELVHVGACAAPVPRVAEDARVDPLAQLRREPEDDQPSWREAS